LQTQVWFSQSQQQSQAQHLGWSEQEAEADQNLSAALLVEVPLHLLTHSRSRMDASK
jgi:hypothetical protein